MKPAIWSSYLYDLSPEAAAEAFAARGWRFSELSTEHSAELVGRGAPAAVGEAFRRRAADCGVSFPQGHLKIDADVAAVRRQEALDELKRWLDLYLAVGVKAAVVHPGGHELRQAGASAEEIRDAEIAAFGALAAHVAGTEVVICIENVARKDDLRIITDVVDSCGSPNLGMCLDTGHLHLAGGRQGDFIRGAGRRLRALHVADNDGSSDQHLIPFARGTIDWSDVLAALREIGYDGLFNFEIPGENRCPLPVRLAKLDYLRAVADFLLADGA